MARQRFQIQFAALGGGFDETVDALAARLNAAEQRAVAAEHRIEQLAGLIAELDQRFTEVLDTVHRRDHPDALDTTILDHQQLAEAADDLFNRVWHTVRQYRPARPAQAMAYVVHGLWNRTVDGLPPGSVQLVAECHDAFRAGARAILDRAATLPTPATFDFDRARRWIDPVRQMAWRGCDPAGDIEFVVTPGYVVGPRVLLRQQVATTPSD